MRISHARVLSVFMVLSLASHFALSQSPALAAFTEQGSTVLGGLNVSGRSALLADIDNDGDLDLFFQGGGSASQKLLRNNVIGAGSFTFTDITSTYLPSPTLQDSWSAAWGDYDGDGRIDVFVGQDNNGSGAQGFDSGDVFKNNWPEPFTNTSAATGLDDIGFHQNVAWADIDNDRDLDLMIGMEGPTEKHEIYLQGPANHFTPVGAAVGFQQNFGSGKPRLFCNLDT
jgi:enediyne biosynthesis protein E4